MSTQLPVIERRYFKAAKGRELRVETAQDGTIHMVGYAAVFNSESEDLGGFRETITPGAFADVLNDDCRFLINHDDLPLARTVSGTLSLKEDNIGLYMDASCEASDIDVQRLLPKMKRKDLDQMSFGFCIGEGGDTWNPQPGEDGLWRRAILKVTRLFDVSVVTFPAYQATQISLRSHGGDKSPLEKMLAMRAEAEKRSMENYAAGAAFRLRMKSKV